MSERPDFIHAYNAVEVPATILFTHQHEAQAAAISGEFFDSVRSALDLGNHTLETFFEMTTQEVVPLDCSELNLEDNENHLRSFRRKGGQTLAAVFYTQGDYHYKIAHFAKYPIHPDTETEIRVMQSVERSIHGLDE